MKQLLKKAKVITILILTLSLIGCEEDDNNYPIVVAGFTYTLNEDTGAVTFINISKNANTYEWDFGDESSSTLINPVKVFPNGTYNITLKAKNVAGASDSYKDELIIGITDPDSCTAETAESISGADLNMTFMSDQTANIIEDGGDFEWIDNPDYSTVNSSCKVGKITKLGNNPWDNNQIDLDAKLDFNANLGLKIKVWSALANTEVRIKLEEIGNPDNKTEQFLTTSVTSGWEELTFPFAAADSDKFNKIVIFFDLNAENTDTYYFDDLMLYGAATGGGTEPTTAAPTPTRDAGDVISIFSDAYTDVTVDTWRTSWSAADYEEVMIAGNATKKYSNLDFVGVETVVNQVDASSMTHIHVDVWSPDFTDFGLKLVDFGPSGNSEHQVDFASPNQGEWISYDIPLSDFTGLTNTTNIAQYIFVGRPIGASTIFLDNIYFYNDGGSTGGGTCPAPPAGDLISNGDFEAGEGCWQLIQNGGTVTISNTVSSGGGTYSGQIQTGPGVNPAVKQERFAVGTYLPNTVYKVTFDIKASTPLTTGAVFKAFTFSEGVDGGTTPATQHILEGGLATVSDSWETKTYTFTSAPNADQVEGGISFLAELVCGPAGCAGVINIDNVSITLN